MNFETLQQTWNTADARLDPVVLKIDKVNKLNAAVRRSIWLQLGELALDILTVSLLGVFIAAHISQPKFLVPALLLDVFAIWMTALTVRHIVLLRQVDLSAPVVASQRQTISVRAGRIFMTKWIFVLCPLIWVPLLIVGLKGAIGVDAYAVLPMHYLVGNIVFGVACVPLLLWASRSLAKRFGSSTFIRSVLDDIAGRSLVETERYLRELSEDS